MKGLNDNEARRVCSGRFGFAVIAVPLTRPAATLSPRRGRYNDRLWANWLSFLQSTPNVQGQKRWAGQYGGTFLVFETGANPPSLKLWRTRARAVQTLARGRGLRKDQRDRSDERDGKNMSQDDLTAIIKCVNIAVYACCCIHVGLAGGSAVPSSRRRFRLRAKHYGERDGGQGFFDI